MNNEIKKAEDMILAWCGSKHPNGMFPVMRERNDGTCVVVDANLREKDPKGKYAHEMRAKVYASGDNWIDVLSQLELVYNRFPLMPVKK